VCLRVAAKDPGQALPVTDVPPKRDRPAGLRTNRMEAFSDGVFAIAITLLVLELSVPAGSGDHLLRAFAEQWPSYLAYVVSSATIGAVWVGHSVITEYLERADAGLIRLNLLLLMVVSFLPFPTGLLAEYVREGRAERVAATIYGITLLLTATMLSVLWRYAVSQGLVHPDAADAELQMITKRLTPGLAGYGALIIIGLFLPTVAVLGYLALALSLLLPFRSMRRGRRRT
jgi:uncharacterized membrane protein